MQEVKKDYLKLVFFLWSDCWASAKDDEYEKNEYYEFLAVKKECNENLEQNGRNPDKFGVTRVMKSLRCSHSDAKDFMAKLGMET